MKLTSLFCGLGFAAMLAQASAQPPNIQTEMVADAKPGDVRVFVTRAIDAPLKSVKERAEKVKAPQNGARSMASPSHPTVLSGSPIAAAIASSNSRSTAPSSAKRLSTANPGPSRERSMASQSLRI